MENEDTLVGQGENKDVLETTDTDTVADVVDVGEQASGVEVDDQGEDGSWTPAQQAAFDKRIGKVVAKQKAAEERARLAESEAQALKDKVAKTEAEKVAHLGVPPQFYSKEEISRVQEAEASLNYASGNASFFENAAAEGEVITVGGKDYTPAQCVKFAAAWSREAGKSEGRMNAVLDSARSRMTAKLAELDARDAALTAVKKKPVVPAIPAKRTGATESAPTGGVTEVVDGGRKITLVQAPDGVAAARAFMST